MKSRLPGANCEKCPLACMQHNGPVPMQGDDNADLIFIGEAPGEHEAMKKQPFVGPSGKLLRGLIQKNNTSGKRVAFTNVVACRPPDNREPTSQEIKACSGRLQLELKRHPKAKRVLLGVNATQAMTGQNYPMKHYNGSWINDYNFVSYHPAFILRNPTRAKVLKVAIKSALGKPIPLHEPVVPFELVEAPPPVSSGLVSIDIENTTKHGSSFKKDKITCVAVNFEGKTWVIPHEAVYGEPFHNWLMETLFNPFVTVVGHNFKSDLKFLIYQLEANYPSRLLDSMLMHYALNEEGVDVSFFANDFKDNKSRGHGLKLLCRKFFGTVWSYDGDWNDPDYPKLYAYCAKDAAMTMRLVLALQNSFKSEPRAGRLYWELLEPASRALCSMEMNGFRIDLARSHEVKAELEAQKKQLVSEMQTILKECGWYDWENFNPAKRTKVEIMYDFFGLPKQLNRDGRLTLDKLALKHLSEVVDNEQIKQFIMLLIAYSNNQTMSGRYIGEQRREIELVDTGKRKRVKKAKEPKGLLSDVVDGLFHPNFNIQATITGRLSADRIHQIPRKSAIHPITKEPINIGKKIKSQFVPLFDDHVIVQADWSQMELRVAAWLSGDERMIAAYNEDKDLHTETARDIYLEAFDNADKNMKKAMRSDCKEVNFGVLYGMVPETLARAWWEKMSPEQRAATTFEQVRKDAEKFYNRWFEVRPGVARWQKQFLREAFTTGKIETIFHRRRDITFIPQDNRSLAELKNHLMNFPIQGMASDCTLHCVIRLDKIIKELGWAVYPMATVHDSIVFSVPKRIVTQFIQLCERVMLDTAIEFFGTTVKFQADFEVGKNWGALNEVAGIIKVNGKDMVYYERKANRTSKRNHRHYLMGRRERVA